MTLVAWAAVIFMMGAVAHAGKKMRALGSILGWAAFVCAATELAMLLSAVLFGSGHPKELIGELIRPVFSVALLVCSIAQLRDETRMRKSCRAQIDEPGRRDAELQQPGRAMTAGL